MGMRSDWFWHTLILVGVAIGYSQLPILGVAPPEWVDRISVWIALGYLYWAWDDGIQAGWSSCRTRAVLRGLLFILVASSPVAVFVAVCKLRDYLRSNPVEFARSADVRSDDLAFLNSDRSITDADDEYLESIAVLRVYEDTNPATGLPMAGCRDVCGHPWGFSSHE